MKKILVVFAVFVTIFQIISCGEDSSSSKNNIIINNNEPTSSCPEIDSNMWSSRSSNEMSWENAVDYCENLNECGYTDWRLPNINELRTLIKNCPETETGGACRVKDPDCLSLSCGDSDCYCEYKENNDGYYSKLGDPDGVDLWSSSLRSDASDYAWYIIFSMAQVRDDGIVYYDSDSQDNYVRCVRGGTNSNSDSKDSDSENEYCNTTCDCKDRASYCDAGYCKKRQFCETPADCPIGWTCTGEGFCITNEEADGGISCDEYCNTTCDCKDRASYCDAGYCKKRQFCETPAECPIGWTCTSEGFCITNEEADGSISCD